MLLNFYSNFIFSVFYILGGVNQEIVYISNKGGSFDIYKNTMNGSNEIRLTSEKGWEWYPQFSNLENSIIYNSQDTAGNFELKIMNVDGKGSKTFNTAIPGFDICPSNSWVAYTRKSGDASNILITNLKSMGDSVKITDNEYYNGRPKWSVDGHKVAYISDRTGNNEIFIYDRLKNETKQLTSNDLREKYISWSPDGKYLATTMQKADEPNDIFIIKIDDGSTIHLTKTKINESEIAWSPDGRYIAYHAKVDGKDDIFILSLESKEITKITKSDGYHGEPAWVTSD